MKKMFTWVGVSFVVMSTLVVGVQAGPLSDATSSALGGIEIGGYLDLSYMYNFNDPNRSSGIRSLLKNNPDLIDSEGNLNPEGEILHSELMDMSSDNMGRVFDTDHDDFVNIQLLNFYIDNLPQETGEVGFRVDIGIGEDADAILGGDPLLIDDNINIYQAFISYIAPMGNGLTVDVGRFATWHGYELIESPYNDNFSRSFLFGYAVPYTHTGIRLTYPINEMVELSGGVTQGWDTVNDNNDSKTFHAAIRYMPTEDIYIQNSFAYGPEQDDAVPGAESDYRFLYDLVATWNIMEDWTLGANFDYANEENIGATNSDADWWGLAGYVRYDVNEDLYLAVRGEYFSDDDGTRSPQPAVGMNDELWEITITGGYQLAEDLLARVELRHDEASEDIFWDDDSLEDTQDTIAAELIYSF